MDTKVFRSSAADAIGKARSVRAALHHVPACSGLPALPQPVFQLGTRSRAGRFIVRDLIG